MQAKQTVLIFGVSSFLGSNLAQSLKDKYRVVGTYFNTQISSKDFLTIKCDIKKPNLVKGIVNLTKPDIVFYCVGNKSINFCHEKPKESDALNTNGAINVINAIDAYNSKFFYFSSSMVYSGSDHEFSEIDTPIPNTAYGNSLASAEFYIQKSYLNYVIIRLPHIFGHSSCVKNATYFEKIQKAMIKKEELSTEDNALYGHLSVNDFLILVNECIEKKLTNLVMNFSSKDSMSFHDFASLYCEIYKEKEEFLSKKSKKIPQLSNMGTQNLRDSRLVFEMNCQKCYELTRIEAKSIKESLIDYKNSFVQKKKKVSLSII